MASWERLPLDVEEGAGDSPPTVPSLKRSVSSQVLEVAADTAAEGVRLVKQMSQTLQPRPVVFCGVCLENVDEAETFSFSGHGGCAHLFCRECLVGYLSCEIRDGNCEPPCPYFCHGDGCGSTACQADVEFLLADLEVLGKYRRFKQMKERPEIRECPKCTQMCLPTRNIFGRVRSEMTCSVCSTEFCFYHSNQHPNERCIDFISRTAKEEVVSTTLIRATCKCCPRCKFPTEKKGGCNHMTCAKCKCDWCWLCNQDISVATTGAPSIEHHYSPHNVWNGCPLSQFSQGNGEFLWLDKITSLLWLAVFVACLLCASVAWLGLLAALVLGTACCCCCCGLQCSDLLQGRNQEMFIFMFLGPPAGLALVAVTLVWVVMSLVWTIAMTPVVALLSPVWLVLIMLGHCEFMDVVKWWGFCGMYLYNSMAVQVVIQAARGERA